MENLKAKSFDLRKDTVDIIVAGKGGHIGGDMSEYIYIKCIFSVILQ